MKEPKTGNDNLQYFSSARQDMIQFVPKTTRTLLEIGCGTGEFSRAIQLAHGSEVWGIEPNIEAATHAGRVLTHVLTGTIEAHINNLPNSFFDCICMNDVIEHLINPWEILQQLKGKLTPQGVLICSIPNVRHYKNLKALLIDGDWRYTDSGVLDKTHLRFFTPKSMQRMFTECDYSISRFQGIRQSRKFLLRILRWLSIGALRDIAYMQFAIVATPNRTSK
jgi:2-polyprenyl-3-methyl-5-hydroxy-6-metoxy-1,4-benzoquinol methylase